MVVRLLEFGDAASHPDPGKPVLTTCLSLSLTILLDVRHVSSTAFPLQPLKIPRHKVHESLGRLMLYRSV